MSTSPLDRGPEVTGPPIPLDDLASGDPRVRERAAAYLGDWLAAAAKSGRDVDPVAAALADALLAEGDPDVQEEIANSLCCLVEYGQVPAAIAGRLARHLTRLDPRAAEYVTDLLEAATWQRPRPTGTEAPAGDHRDSDPVGDDEQVLERSLLVGGEEGVLDAGGEERRP